MNPLHLSGWGVKIRVSNIEERSELWITDGRQDNDDSKSYAFPPRQIPHDSIIVESHSGYISMQALHWLARNNIPLFIMNYDGAIISQMLPPIPIKADLRIAQIDASRDPKKKFTIAKANETYGFRLQKQFQALLQASALDRGRKSVNRSDVDRVLRLMNWVNFDEKPIA